MTKSEVRFVGLDPSAALREHAQKRIASHLGRFGAELTRVVVRLADVNGPKGGPDKRCQVIVQGPRLGTATLEETREDPHAAIDVAIRRVSESLSRQLDRQETRQRSRPAPARGAS